MNDGTESYPLTDDPELIAQLQRRWATGTSSEALAEFAVSLGLRPPRYRAFGQLPPIVEVWPPGADEGVLEWDLHDIEEADPEEGRH